MSRFLALPARLRGDSAFAIADQILVSGLNFLVGIVAARILDVADFGLFTLVLMIANLASVAAGHMLTMPMLTLTGARPRRSPAYFAAILRLGIVFCLLGGLAVALTIGAIGMLRAEPVPVPVLLAAAFLAFGQNVHTLVRSVLFVRRDTRRALLLDVSRIAVVVLCALLARVAMGGAITIAPLLTLLGASALVVVLPRLWAAMRVPVRTGLSARLLRRHWPLSKWMLLMMLVSIGQEQALWVVVGVSLGDAALGALRAGQYLLGTTHFLMFAFENFMPRNAAEAFRARGAAGLRAYLTRQTLLFGGASFLLIAVIAAFAGPLLALTFGERYTPFAGITRVFALAYLAMVPRAIWSYYLRTVERTSAIFWSFTVSSALAIVVVYPAIARFGIDGAAWTMVLAQGVCLGLVLLAVARHDAEPRARSWLSARLGAPLPVPARGTLGE